VVCWGDNRFGQATVPLGGLSTVPPSLSQLLGSPTKVGKRRAGQSTVKLQGQLSGSSPVALDVATFTLHALLDEVGRVGELVQGLLSSAKMPSWPPRSQRGSIDGKPVSRELATVKLPLTTAAEGYCDHQHKSSSSPRHTILSDDNSCRAAKKSVRFGAVRAVIFQCL
jgi:hypothetical protein